ncbi:MAG: UTP--glucose-1-phosphate uridylyltransferase [Parcubacteria group bacterium]|nr:UTP--glucose-1-phosphate uridylyltransferase [Parcubacteria group bacterium]
MSKIKKVIIPVAGLGTRFLPATKAQPKEMLPIVDKPIIQYIIESAVESGIEDIILVTGKTKRAIEDHFDQDEFLERYLIEAGKEKYAEKIRKISKLANFIYIRQKGPYGNGTPVLNAKHIIGDEPFAVLWGDDIWNTPRVPHLKQLMDVFEKYGDPVISAMMTDDEGTGKYGIIDGVKIGDDTYEVKSIIEKPGAEKAPSRIASLGGYIFTPDIFLELEKTPVGKGNELWLVDAIARLLEKRPIYAKIIDGDYMDIGSKLGFLKANVHFGLNDADVKDELKKYLKEVLK